MFSKLKLSLVTFDAVVITASCNFGFWCVFRSGFFREPRQYPVYYIPSIILMSVILLSAFQLAGLYKYQNISSSINQIRYISQTHAKALAVLILVVFFMKSKYFADSRLTIGLSFLTSFILMVLFRAIILPAIYFHFVSRGKFRKRTLIIGAGRRGKMLCRYLKMNPKSYFEVIGFCDDDADKVGTTLEGLPVFGTSYDLDSLIAQYSIREIIIAISKLTNSAMLDLVDRCKKMNIVIHIVSDLYAQTNEKIQAEEFGGLRTFRIAHKKLGLLGVASKRALDLVGSVVLLTLLSPVLLLIAWTVKRGSEGPVFYKAKVIGKGGKPFEAYKFRSMYIKNRTTSPHNHESDFVTEAEERHVEFMKSFIQGRTGREYYVKNEDRITKVGCFLRKHSLDELPQLINVFHGEMSLVGPRFCTARDAEFCKPWHKRRFQVKPGMTGLWQVRARSAVSYDDMVILDLYYINNWSLLFDLEILIRTIPIVFNGSGSRVEEQKDKSLEDKIQELSLKCSG